MKSEPARQPKWSFHNKESKTALTELGPHRTRADPDGQLRRASTMARTRSRPHGCLLFVPLDNIYVFDLAAKSSLMSWGNRLGKQSRASGERHLIQPRRYRARVRDRLRNTRRSVTQQERGCGPGGVALNTIMERESEHRTNG